MDRRTDPYAPGAGTPPPELVGRDELGKGMAYSPAHGDTAFTVPHFDGASPPSVRRGDYLRTTGRIPIRTEKATPLVTYL